MQIIIKYNIHFIINDDPGENMRKGWDGNMNSLISFLLSFGYLFLLVWVLILIRKQNILTLSNIILLVLIGLIYDNFIIAIGKYVSVGTLLENLSYPRYWLHALFTPTLILFVWSICVEKKLTWAKNFFIKAFAWLLTLGLIVYELLTSIKGLELETKWEHGLLTYADSNHSMNGVMVIIITTVLLAIGFIFWKKLHFPWLFVGTVLMIIGSGLAIVFKGFPVMNISEFIFMYSLVLTKRFTVD